MQHNLSPGVVVVIAAFDDVPEHLFLIRVFQPCNIQVKDKDTQLVPERCSRLRSPCLVTGQIRVPDPINQTHHLGMIGPAVDVYRAGVPWVSYC